MELFATEKTSKTQAPLKPKPKPEHFILRKPTKTGKFLTSAWCFRPNVSSTFHFKLAIFDQNIVSFGFHLDLAVENENQNDCDKTNFFFFFQLIAVCFSLMKKPTKTCDLFEESEKDKMKMS